MYDFIYNIWFIYNGYDGNGRKKPEKYMYMKNKEKFPVWLPSHPPVYKIGLVGLFIDWSPLLPYMADETAHYAEKVGDTQQLHQASSFVMKRKAV